MLGIKGERELFKFQSSDRKRLQAATMETTPCRLSGNTYLRSPQQKGFLRNELLLPVRERCTQTGFRADKNLSTLVDRRAFRTVHVSGFLKLTAKVKTVVSKAM